MNTAENDTYRERIHDYLDGELSGNDRATFERHLRTCDACRETVDGYRALEREARALPRPEPPSEVWDRISASLGHGNPRGAASPSFRSRLPDTRVWLALAAAVVLGVALWGLRMDSPPEPQAPTALVDQVTEELRLAEGHYDKAIDGLELIIAQNEDILPSELNVVLNQNLDLIEQAIIESRDAINTAPESTVAQESLMEALRRKVALLQSTIQLINEVRKGEGQNALDLIDKIQHTEEPSNPI